ncbi:MAG TPA: nickel pincer cofactor biosynthesis protein LarC [Candidatus Acidoferrales bacterium]|nr:nickel pincer cofactor biosynthesis protein LarC [Candidatus Acidoferrales bacterium]
MKSKGIAHFDCFSGISGDMVLGALVDAGADLAALEGELRKLNLLGWSISAEKVRRGAIVATQVKVRAEEHKSAEQEVSSGAKAQVHGGGHTGDLKVRPPKKHAETPGHHHNGSEVEERHRRDAGATSDSAGGGHPHHHRGLSEIVKMIDAAGLPPRAAERAKRIFQRLGEAEAKVHGVAVEKVHFHEVGAVDSIIDIVGAAVGFDLLGIDEFGCSAFDVGGGQVNTEHGVLPVPAPATVELLRGAPTHSSGVQRELVTPTGAAIATTLASTFGTIPAMSLRSVGYGAGSADLVEKANVLRLLIGERIESGTGEWDAPVTVIETNVDDMSPQIYSYFAEKALAAGALDVFSTPAQMKKNRPGLLITILSETQNTAPLIDLVFRETTTIGVRTHEVRRKTLDREFVPVETRFGRVRMKVSRMNGSLLNATPEYDDCQRIAMERGVPLKEVIAAASFEFEAKRQGRTEAGKRGEKKGS